MNISDHLANQSIWGKFASLKKSIDEQRKVALKKRISDKPQASDLEYLLGAFLEMYEPHLIKIVQKLAKKGFALEASSGFGGKNSEFQVMTGNFSIDYVNKNKLEKIGVKFREYNGFQSLVFWPKKALVSSIVESWKQILESLPSRGILSVPSNSASAIKFRRKYIPQDKNLQKQRVFEKLKFSTQRKVYIEIKKRQKENSHPDKIELILGLFVQELEPQVRTAVIEMNRKGYSTDKSGFMDNPMCQMIEGDFQLDEKTKIALEELGVQVETNPSGYTRLQFFPLEANLLKIKNKWNKIVSLLPNKNQTATISMTRKARDFRMKYQ